MATLAQLQAWKAALEAARYKGLRTVEYGDRKMEYRTDAEMRIALADLTRQIDAASGSPSVSMIRISSSKGI
jgi:hypothetical protein